MLLKLNLENFSHTLAEHPTQMSTNVNLAPATIPEESIEHITLSLARKLAKGSNALI